jgi:sporulation protein YlmC with PRC-barrel domain
MAKLMTMAFLAVFALGLFAASAYASEEMAKGMNRPCGLSELLGSTVNNLQGDYLGRITDLVVDLHGRVAFAVLSHGGFLGMGGTSVAIPFEALTFNQMDRDFALDITRERLNSAPAFGMRDLTNEKWAEDVYHYFGRQPYWTEGGLVKEGMEPMKKEPRGTMDYPYGVYPYGEGP